MSERHIPKMEDFDTQDLVDALNERLIRDNTLDLELGMFEGAKYCVDQSTSGQLTPSSIESALSKMISHGQEPEFLIVPQDEQMRVRRDEYFTSCTRKYVQNGVIGTFMDITVLVSDDLRERAYLIEGDLTDDKYPEQICKIVL